MEYKEVYQLNIQFKKGVIELCIFSLLIKRDYYAYELTKELVGTFKVSESALYPLLRRMDDEGYFETYIHKELGKKFYRLSTKGIEAQRDYYSEWKDFTSRVNNLVQEDI